MRPENGDRRWTRPWPIRHVAICAVASFALGLAAGALAPTSVLREAPSDAAPASSEPDARPASSRSTPARASAAHGELALESLLAQLRLAAEVRSLREQLAEQEDDAARAALVRERIAAVVDDVSERELRGLLATGVRMSDEELDEIEDLRGFGLRVAEIAMDGFLEDAAPAPDESAAGAVYFTDEMPDRSAGFEASEVFDAGHGRIYAVFRTPRDHPDRVLLKWARVDRPEILLLARQSIRPDEAHGFVWLDRRPSWQQGEYRVDVYGGDDDMEPIASGRYSIQ